MDYLHKNVPSHAPKAPPGVLQQMVAYQPALEAPRREWFIAGTESAVIAVVGDTVKPAAIVYPAEDSILAIDPDIPPALQRLLPGPATPCAGCSTARIWAGQARVSAGVPCRAGTRWPSSTMRAGRWRRWRSGTGECLGAAESGGAIAALGHLPGQYCQKVVTAR
jgi:hypothetical protein